MRPRNFYNSYYPADVITVFNFFDFYATLFKCRGYLIDETSAIALINTINLARMKDGKSPV
jgi:hypothetical protein